MFGKNKCNNPSCGANCTRPVVADLVTLTLTGKRYAEPVCWKATARLERKFREAGTSIGGGGNFYRVCYRPAYIGMQLA